MTIYLDNAATTFPKPEEVYKAVDKTMRNCANPGRSGHKMALESGRVIYRTRELLARLFSVDNPMDIILTHNATESLNLGIKGLLKMGEHVITTSVEHNSVLRPLKALEDKGIIQLSIVQGNKEGYVSPEDIKSKIRKNTKMIITTHASNVVGTILPIAEIGKIAKENKFIYMVDASQSVGVYDIDVHKMNIDIIAFPGHKGLLGPQGTGGLYVKEGISLQPLWEGGTGSQSESLYQPNVLPDRYESGTHNTIGIAGLGAGVEFILKEGIEKIREHEEYLTQRLINGLLKIEDVYVYGPRNAKNQAAVVSFNVGEIDSGEISFILDHKYDIASRAGLHCAPLTHKTIGTLDQGTVRLSLGYFNTVEEIDIALKAIKEIRDTLI